ncbi:uncharacterized protein LOC126780114 isoform X2 [Nymphalis io]|uniref:uncharacterized protein LOC126780114 isoform X2 n=1 Tax=Inachis io TaxID=171585 RepID=UPI0021683E79|nr:uncharacterized protein LOC126780114 isoform X2 [Nymphalis io]
MRVVFIFLLCFVTVLGANKHTKSLTESMGQEVIEINSPLKELPPDLDEEPSAENDDDNATSTTVQVATTKEVTKKVLENFRPDTLKDIEKIDRQKDDEEARIEKELADIYKDSLDYKADSAEATKEAVKSKPTEPSEKPIARARSNFKFQPDSNNPREVAMFRTSVDDISCKNDKLLESTTLPTSGCRTTVSNIGLYAIMPLIYMYM